MAALIPIFIQFLPTLVKAAQAVPEVIGFIQRTHEVLKQSKEWTSAEQAAFDKHLEEVTSEEQWKLEGE
jgi:hypothetical protein